LEKDPIKTVTSKIFTGLTAEAIEMANVLAHFEFAGFPEGE
jgi:hypothetical protein